MIQKQHKFVAIASDIHLDQQRLCDHFKFDTWDALTNSIETQMAQYLTEEKSQFLDVIIEKIHALQNQFGMGVFVCSYDNKIGVKSLDAFNRFTDTMRIIGSLKWLSYSEININAITKIIAPIPSEIVFILIFIEVDYPLYFPYGTFYPLDSLNKYYDKLQYLKKLKVKTFAKVHPAIFMEHKQLNHINNTIMYLPYCLELRWFLLGELSEEPIEESIRRIRDKYLPKEEIAKFVNDKIQNDFMYIYGEEIENVVTKKCNELFRLAPGEETNIRRQLRLAAIVPSLIIHQIKNIELMDIMIEFFSASNQDKYIDCVVKDFHHKIASELGFKRLAIQCDLFLGRLAGRECGNCKKAESRDINKIEFFAKCSGCRQVNYCGRKCQKIHWKSHRLECAKYNI